MVAALTAFAEFVFAFFRSRTLLLVFAMFFKDIFVWLFSSVLGMAVNALNAINFNIPTLTSVMGLLPPDMLMICKRVGLDNCLALIASAYSIRATIQLLGWVRALKPRV